MGVVATIGYDSFPKQTRHVGTQVTVCFNYDTSRILLGRVIRDDAEAPFETLIMLQDERCVRGVECMWSPSPLERAEEEKRIGESYLEHHIAETNQLKRERSDALEREAKLLQSLYTIHGLLCVDNITEARRMAFALLSPDAEGKP